jgi:hypothetical protein
LNEIGSIVFKSFFIPRGIVLVTFFHNAIGVILKPIANPTRGIVLVTFFSPRRKVLKPFFDPVVHGHL